MSEQSSIYSNRIDRSKRKQTLEAPETISGADTEHNTGKTSNRENWGGKHNYGAGGGEQTNRIEVMFTRGGRTTNNTVIVSTSIIPYCTAL